MWSNTPDYALSVHEDLEAHHENGHAKFLSSAMNDTTSDLGTRLARRRRFEKWVNK